MVPLPPVARRGSGTLSAPQLFIRPLSYQQPPTGKQPSAGKSMLSRTRVRQLMDKNEQSL